MYQELRTPKLVKVRTNHKCEWCPEPIRVGDTVMRRVYVYDGYLSDSRSHPECYAAMQELFSSPEYWNWDEGFEPQGFDRGTTDERGTAERALAYADQQKADRRS